MIMLSVNRMRQTTTISSPHNLSVLPPAARTKESPAFEVAGRSVIWTKAANKYLVISCMINVKVN